MHLKKLSIMGLLVRISAKKSENFTLSSGSCSTTCFSLTMNQPTTEMMLDTTMATMARII